MRKRCLAYNSRRNVGLPYMVISKKLIRDPFDDLKLSSTNSVQDLKVVANPIPVDQASQILSTSRPQPS